MRRLDRRGAAIAISAAAAVVGAALAAEPPTSNAGDEALPGGATTVWAEGKNAFSFPAANLPDAERTRFAIGNSFFKRNWVQAGASASARDGLGPHFIARSCGGCHSLDGRGAPPAAGEAAVALLLRLSVPGTDAHGGPKPDPVYGDQLANAAIPGVRPEGRVVIRHETVQGRFDDGTPWTLRKPVYSIGEPAYGPPSPDLMIGPRIAPQLIGVGLLEAIPEVEILANAAAQAAAPGPVKGRPNRVRDLPTGRADALGRFGWKANVATIAHQTAGAFHGDIGITSPWFPAQGCTAAQRDCAAAPGGGHGDATEIDAKTLADVVFYQAVLAPPARRDAADATVQRGRALFAQAGCAVCHRPSYVTGTPPLPALSSAVVQGQTIWPYTDLLLHDMGDGLADGRPDFGAGGRDWKTPALWGTGRIHAVNGHRRLLHDGRADGVMEAVLWHGGEAEAARRAVLAFTREDREALVRFVESL